MLDTNIVSETRKPQPNAGVIGWRYAQDPAHLFFTTITLREVWLGFHRLPTTHADYGSIKRFVTDLPATYRVLKFDLRAASVWGELAAKANGPLPLRDSFIAAIARSRGCSGVTRDGAPFARLGVKVINPWR